MVKVEVSNRLNLQKDSKEKTWSSNKIFVEQKYLAGPNSFIYNSLKLTAKAPAGKKNISQDVSGLTQPNES